MTGNSLSSDQAARQAALSVLSHADPARLAQLWADWADKPAVTRVRGPETGLVMVRGRAGGGGNPFNLGEATVTRATVRLDSGEVGHAWCLGRDSDKALSAACFDALFQSDSAAVEWQVLAPLRDEQAATDTVLAEETASTKVDFFTMVRGED